MKKMFGLLLALLIVSPLFAAFDKSRLQYCFFQITCDDGRRVAFHVPYTTCESGWGFCFSSETCGDGFTVGDLCNDPRVGGGGGSGGGGGGGGGGDACLFDPFHCNPFATGAGQ